MAPADSSQKTGLRGRSRAAIAHSCSQQRDWVTVVTMEMMVIIPSGLRGPDATDAGPGSIQTSDTTRCSRRAVRLRCVSKAQNSTSAPAARRSKAAASWTAS